MEYLKELKVQYVQSDKPNLIEGQVCSPRDIYTLFKDLEDDAKEKILGVYLDAQMNINTFEVLFIGTEDACMIAPKQIFKGALLTNSPNFILIHNHPSGNPDPSKDDRDLIERVDRIADDLNMNFIDFVVIGRDDYWSRHDHYGEEK